MNLLYDASNKKILIRGPDTVGSFVLATPFYRELRKNFTKSYIVLCVKPLVTELAYGCPYVDKVVIYETKNIFQKIKFLSWLRKEKFDIAFLLSGSFEAAAMVYLSGIKVRIGYSHDHRGFLLTHKVKELQKKHYVDYILNILESQKLKVENRQPELFLSYHKLSWEIEEILNLKINVNDKIVGLSFTVVGEKARNWPKEYAVELIRELTFNGIKTILFGTKKAEYFSKYVEDKIKNNNFINLVGKTSLLDFINVLKLCNIYVSVSTGGIHIASVLGVKIIGLYCPGDEIGWRPFTENVKIITKYQPCAPCNQHKMKYCKNNICMQQITPQEVAKQIYDWL